MTNPDVDSYAKTLNHRKIIRKTQKNNLLKRVRPGCVRKLQCGIHPRTSGRMDCDVIDVTPRQTNRPKKAVTSMCMEVTYKRRLLGLSLLALADFAHM